METVTFRIDSAKGTIRIDRPLFLGATYAVAVDGYATDTPQIVFADCDGRPVAEVADGTLSLDTEELLAVFTAAGISGAPGVVTVHAWALNEAGSNIAAADIPVFYAPYFSAPSGTLKRIDVKGPKGDPGPKGDKGDKGDDGVCVPVSGWLAFEVDENSHLILHAATENDVYATTNGVIDHAKPRFTIETVGDERHLLYHFYGDSTNFHYVVDLGNVRGGKGDPGEQGDPGQDGSTDASATLAGTSLDTSDLGGLRAAVQTIGRALGATVTAIALCLSAPADAQDVSLADLAGLAITNGVGVITNVNLSGLQPRLPYPTNAIPAAAVTDAPWLSGEADPSVGMTNGTIYVKGASITPLTEHQSLAPVVDYVDAKTTEVGEVAAARVVNATNALMQAMQEMTPAGGGGADGETVTNIVNGIVAADETLVRYASPARDIDVNQTLAVTNELGRRVWLQPDRIMAWTRTSDFEGDCILEFPADTGGVIAVRGDIDAVTQRVDVASSAVVRYASGVLRLDVPALATLSADTSGWPDGAAVMCRLSAHGAYAVAPGLDLVGYGLWPTNSASVVLVRDGARILANVMEGN